MFSALAASASTILAALLQKLKIKPKHLLLFICILAVICAVFVIRAIATEKPHDDKENTERSVTIGISIDIKINFSILKKEEIRENFDDIKRLYRETGPEEAREITNSIEEKLNEHE